MSYVSFQVFLSVGELVTASRNGQCLHLPWSVGISQFAPYREALRVSGTRGERCAEWDSDTDGGGRAAGNRATLSEMGILSSLRTVAEEQLLHEAVYMQSAMGESDYAAALTGR